MNRRRHNILALALATAVALAASSTTPARASGLTKGDYQIVTTGALAAPDPNAGGPQVVAAITPTGGVVPPTQTDGSQGTPLAIDLNAYKAADGTTYQTDANAFSTDKLVVGLKDVPASGSDPSQQLIGLSFFGSGLAQGSATSSPLFKLNVADPDNAPTLVSETPGVSIKYLLPYTAPATPVTPPATTPTDGGSGTTTTTTTTSTDVTTPSAQVPEPASVALWSVVAGAGLFRARRRLRRPAA